MSDLALMAASRFAQAHAEIQHDPVAFGRDVALAYLACRDTEHHAGDEKATAAALASLSIPIEALQLLAQLSAHFPRSKAEFHQAHSGSAE